MATTTFTNRHRYYLSQGALNASTDTHRLALYNNSNHDANSNAYTTTAEVVGTGYVAKGNTLTGIAITNDTANNVVYWDYNDTQWSSATITATDCMIFADNVTSPAADPALYIGDFGGSRSSSAGTFEVRMPSAGPTTAIIRYA